MLIFLMLFLDLLWLLTFLIVIVLFGITITQLAYDSKSRRVQFLFDFGHSEPYDEDQTDKDYK